MGVKKKYETDTTKTHAEGEHGQVVSRSLFAVVERGDMPLDSGYGEAALVEVEPRAVMPDGHEETPIRIRIDTVPQDTIAVSPDKAAMAAAAMLTLSNSGKDHLAFRVDYQD